uniref:Uncharacterized protein n=1 Tax=Candidatus Kentrum sp. FW TaxID=2126338 RepID=A0A450U206_9GAMM|nr:MAG: hypothetical protein BECKFW1821C_GA0114237_11094 [Candidatus Kentron sp. FW]
MEIKLTEREKIKIINGDDVFSIMRKVLSRENKIDWDKEHFRVCSFIASRTLPSCLTSAFIVLRISGRTPHAARRARKWVRRGWLP